MRHRPGNSLLLLVGMLWLGIGGCASDYGDAMPTDNGSEPHAWPTPRTGSILPLQQGNAWAYTDSRYDTNGTAIYARAELNLAIPSVYGITAGNTFDTLSWSSQDTYDHYAYALEAEGRGKGVLVDYRDIDVDTPGVYLLGRYDSGTRTVYPTPVLWLAYPGTEGMTWECAHDSTLVTITILATDTSFYFPDAWVETTAPVRFVSSCYLYREDDPRGSTYRYFSAEYGELAGLRYEQGQLVRTYVLTQSMLY